MCILFIVLNATWKSIRMHYHGFLSQNWPWSSVLMITSTRSSARSWSSSTRSMIWKTRCPSTFSTSKTPSAAVSTSWTSALRAMLSRSYSSRGTTSKQISTWSARRPTRMMRTRTVRRCALPSHHHFTSAGVPIRTQSPSTYRSTVHHLLPWVTNLCSSTSSRLARTS